VEGVLSTLGDDSEKVAEKPNALQTAPTHLKSTKSRYPLTRQSSEIVGVGNPT